ncbi:hypothetical protein Poli38472_010688 [Pythium oligandrum]|uniref:Transmembrane protein n=1 Tax=Pythium oligandrum TaxID=41045 RepID=A0A8K1CF23_PYTOL|nr:hypothetical protein Poli38472_010688 [Pythium oligandrum]|eukprot:TMW61625.1 hypothetical protein Poli38472_010688 [Pythium oligandrum]
MASLSVVNALFGSYDLRSSKQWRDEDMAHREQEIQWLNDEIVRAHEWRNADIERSLRKEKLENEHLVCEARAEQLHTVSEQCALLCGFTVVAMTNLNIPLDLDRALLISYATIATLVCVLLLLATVICTFLLLAVTRYAGYSLEESVRNLDVIELETESPFSTWWLKKCEHEQMTAYKFMVVGVVLFFIYLSLVAWIQFTTSAWTSSTITLLCFVGLLTWQLRIASRWRYLLKPPSQTPLRQFSTSLLTPHSLHTPLTQRGKRKSSTNKSLPTVPSPTRLASPSYATPYR